MARVAHWATPVTLATVLVLSCLTGESSRPIGGRCSSDSDCAGGLLCRYGRCRSACTFDRDCAEGEICVAVPASDGLRLCTVPADHECADGGEDCPSLLWCDEEGNCVERCSDSCTEPYECVDDVCVDPNTDGDGDGDVDADVDGDADVDADADTSIDGSSDADGQVDGDSDLDSDHDGGTSPVDCLLGPCGPGEVCCGEMIGGVSRRMCLPSCVPPAQTLILCDEQRDCLPSGLRCCYQSALHEVSCADTCAELATLVCTDVRDCPGTSVDEACCPNVSGVSTCLDYSPCPPR